MTIPGSGISSPSPPPEPFDYDAIARGDYWDYRLIDGGRIQRDPYVVLTDLAERIAPDGGLRLRRRFPTTSSGTTTTLGSSATTATPTPASTSGIRTVAPARRFELVIYDDPRYYPYRSGRGRNVVVSRPTHPGARFVFRDAQPGRDSVTREASGGRTDDQGRRRGGTESRSSLDVGWTRLGAHPGVQPPGGGQPGRRRPCPGPAESSRSRAGPRRWTARRRGRTTSDSPPQRVREPAPPAPRTLALGPADSQTPQHRRARASPPQALKTSPWIRALAIAAGTALVAAPARGQGLAEGAVESIGSADMAARVGILSDDSMMGRDTPSAGLERAAAYVIGEFQRLGLRPAGENGTYLQRFGVTRWDLDTAVSRIRLSTGVQERHGGLHPRRPLRRRPDAG